jgi:hypothetical protein
MKIFILYTEALELKKLGFNEPCLSYFDSRLEHQLGNFDFTEIKGYNESPSALAPLYQQAFRWFRENHGIHSWIINAEDNVNVFKPFFRMKTGEDIFDQHMIDWYDSHEEAELACLRELIKIVKQHKITNKEMMPHEVVSNDSEEILMARLEQKQKHTKKEIMDFLEEYDSYRFRGGHMSAEEYYVYIFGETE